MPELPEVETSRRGIEPHIVNQTVHRIEVRQRSLRYLVSEEIIHLKNKTILSVQRRAKYLLLKFKQGWIVIHLGMSGHIRILSEPTKADKHDHIDMHLANGKILRYTDPRRFGFWLWCTTLSEYKAFALLGPEPLSDNFNTDYLIKHQRKRIIAVKNWIMDNHIVVGVGNIYASESLYKAGILPMRPVNTLTVHELDQLVSSIKTVIHQAIIQGGTTLKDFLQADGNPGYFAQQLYVYGRSGQSCLVCQSLILSQKIGQRNSFYCSVCQK